jgi:cysteine desulfurase / selenocysteine lyase
MSLKSKEIDSTLSMQAVREDMPFLTEVVYLNSASCSPTPKPVIDAMTDYYQRTPINYRSGSTPAERRVTERVDGIRARLAEFIGAGSSREVVFTKNTTEAINTVARGIKWQKGDEVILTPLEHQSNLLPWQALQTLGVTLKFLTPNPDGIVPPEAINDAITARTRLVTIHHVSNLLGCVQDIAGIAKITREHGVALMVDAAQSEGRVKVDVGAMGCDYLVSCARKGMMGPQGIGFLWAKEDLLENLEPLTIGSQSAEVTDFTSFDRMKAPFKHEAGIMNTAGIIGFGRALEYLEDIGVAAIGEHVKTLAEHLREGLSRQADLTLHGPRSAARQTGIVSWSIAGRDPQALAAELYETGRILAAAGTCGSPLATRFLGVPGVVRTSLHCFNTHGDVDRLLEVLHASG